jgi:hypothetical protein
MNRRKFLGASAMAGLSTAAINVQSADASGRQFYELRRYTFGAPKGDLPAMAAQQRQRFDTFMREAALPGLNRLGLKPVGVFFPTDGASAAYVVIPHPSADSIATLGERLTEDHDFLSAASDYIDATAEEPAYKRIESSILHAFTGMPRLETPVKNSGRVFQLRIYESPSEKTNLKKIEMFNDAGEIRIFREVGLAPVFFGRAIAGEKIPNLTYMLAFESEDALKANWRKFGAHPDWQKLKAMSEYADKDILSGITNIVLKPAEYSQI